MSNGCRGHTRTDSVRSGTAGPFCPGSSTLTLYKYDGTYPGADGYVVRVSGHYEI